MNPEMNEENQDPEKKWKEFEAEIDDLPEDTLVLNEGDFNVEDDDVDTLGETTVQGTKTPWVQTMQDVQANEENKRLRAERAADADTLDDVYPSKEPRQDRVVGWKSEDGADAATTFEMTDNGNKKEPNEKVSKEKEKRPDAPTLDNLLTDAERTWPMRTSAEGGKANTGDIANVEDALDAAKKAADAAE
jgi:hypothetical protein